MLASINAMRYFGTAIDQSVVGTMTGRFSSLYGGPDMPDIIVCHGSSHYKIEVSVSNLGVDFRLYHGKGKQRTALSGPFTTDHFYLKRLAQELRRGKLRLVRIPVQKGISPSVDTGESEIPKFPCRVAFNGLIFRVKSNKLAIFAEQIESAVDMRLVGKVMDA